MSYPPWSLSCVEKKEKGSVPSRLPGWEPGAVKEEVALSKRECPLYFYREIRENCESLCSLFLLVHAVRVVRGSCFSTGVSLVDSETVGRGLTRIGRELRGRSDP